MCVAGARWVQENILEPNPDADIQVYAIWLPILLGDGIWAWEDSILTDPRVTEFWDQDRVTGRWFAHYHDFEGRSIAFESVWDRHFLYPANVAWGENELSPPLTTGFPIVAHTDELAAQIEPLLQEGQ